MQQTEDMAGRFNPPDTLDFGNPQTWPQWKKRYEIYTVVSKLDKEEKDVQVSTLIYCMGPDAEQIFSSFTFASEEERKDPEKVMEKFDLHFIPKKNVIFERAKFNSRTQELDESVEAYVRALYVLVENCDYGVKKDDFVRDRLVIGLRDKETSQLLQLEGTLTLERAIETCRHRELVQSQNSTKGSECGNIDSMRSRHVQKTFKRFKGKKDKKDKCDKCGYDVERSHAKGSCPAADATCNKCKKKGHFQKCCRTKVVAVAENTDREDNKELFLGAVEKKETKAWYEVLNVSVKENEPHERFKLDSGADETIVSK